MGRRCAFVGDVENVDPGAAFQCLARHDPGGVAARKGELARIGLCVSDQFGECFCRYVLADHQHEYVAADARDQHEILHGIVAERLEQVRIGGVRRIRRHQQRVSVRRGACHVGRRQHAARADLVLHHDALAECVLQILRNDARDEVVPLPAANGTTMVIGFDGYGLGARRDGGEDQ